MSKGLKPEDLTIDSFRRPGDPDVSRTSTAARITHKKGVQVSCWVHRSYAMNRNACLKMLESLEYDNGR